MEVLRAYDHAWNAAQQPEVRGLREYTEGEEILRDYHEANRHRPCAPIFLEERFDVRLGGHRLTGAIDRVDATDSGYEVIDYKLDRELRSQGELDEDLQLGLYHLALREAHGIRPEALSLYFLRHNLKLTTLRSPVQIDDLKQWVEATAEQIVQERRWEPCPGQWCAHCDFRPYCPAVTDEPLPVPEAPSLPAAPEQATLPFSEGEDRPSDRQLKLEIGA
jgi:putative RecB family exonuclease